MDEKKKTTMSVPEMRRMLGLGKTDSYWLVHRQCFETIIVAGKMRVVIDSFENWYANQIKYKKVDGSPPGTELRAYSYSVPELAELLGVSDDTLFFIVFPSECFSGRREIFRLGLRFDCRLHSAAHSGRWCGGPAAAVRFKQRPKLVSYIRFNHHGVVLCCPL